MKLIFLALLFITTIFMSCDSDDDNTNFTASAESFVGVYNTTSSTSEGEDSFTSNGEPMTASFSEVGSDFDLVWTFTANNTYSIIGSYTSTYTETENGVTETDVDVESVNQTGDYVLDLANDELIIISEEEPASFDIISFTENNLEFGIT